MNTPKGYKAIITLESKGWLLGGTRKHESSVFDSKEDAQAFAVQSEEVNRNRPGYQDATILTRVEPVYPKVGRTKRAKQAQEIQFHSDSMLGANSHPAINVKYRGDAPSEHAWEVTVEQFWMFAQDIAHEHGYSGVFSEGRSSGWLVPFFQSAGGKLQKFTQWPGQGPELGYPTYPDVEKPAERKQFIRFQKAILELLASVPEMLKENNPAGIRCNQCEACMINGVFCHETGCPNSGSRYDSDSGEWIKQRKCFECGCTVDKDDLCCAEPFDADAE